MIYVQICTRSSREYIANVLTNFRSLFATIGVRFSAKKLLLINTTSHPSDTMDVDMQSLAS